MSKTCLVLIGMAGVGKSTIGLSLAKELGFDFIDLDIYVCQKEGRIIQQIIDEAGESALLELEKQRMYEIDPVRKVVAPGGSIIDSPEVMQCLKRSSYLIFLKDAFEDIEKKLVNPLSRGIVGLKSKSLREIYDEGGVIFEQSNISKSRRKRSGRHPGYL